MSKLSRYNLLISLIRYELGCSHVLGSSAATSENENIIQRGVEAWIFLTEDLMCDCSINDQARNTRISNLIKLINSSDFSHVIKLLKKIYDVLIRHISRKESLTSYIDFKDQFSEVENSFLGYLCSPIKESLLAVITTQTLLSNGCYTNKAKRDMWRCSHYLLFLTKLNFKDVGLEEQALDDYLMFEKQTSALDIDRCIPYIAPIQVILSDWLSDWSYDGLSSQHGPGSVADARHEKIDKYLNFSHDQKVDYLYQNDINHINTILPFGGVVRHLKRCSKLVFVPKDITKLRSISMEPTTLQYLQQGCMNSLMKYFSKHRQLRNILKLADQDQNKALAYHGSITDDYATIDLSHASDSVNWQLTKKLFARVPKLLKWMLCTRSTHTLLPNGEELELSKFAPMGSSLCFPVESLIFAAIAKLSISLSREESLHRNNENGICDCNSFFSVYGDDIIIPRYAASKCMQLLELFGFEPNDKKSYLFGPFKESCGGNFFCGYDITGLKFTPNFDRIYPFGVSPQAYSALCSYANLAYIRRLPMFRLYCIKLIFESGCKPLFSDKFDTSPAIYSPTPTNFHLKKVWKETKDVRKPSYQKFVYRYTGLKTVVKGASIEQIEQCGHIFMYDCLHSNVHHDYSTSEYNLNMSISNDMTIKCDVMSPYNVGTLLPNTLTFSSCECDV